MADPRWSVQGKTIFVTGAARGIGAESARQLAARGANVALVGLEPEELEKMASQCGPNAAWFEADVTDWDALEQAVSGTVERFGGIDGVIANAGIYSGGTTRTIAPAGFEKTIDINLLGVFRTVRACLPQVIERNGYVLIIASLAAVLHSPGMAAYAASKAGAEAFGNALRQELRHLGVDVGVGYFAFIDTELVRGGDQHPAFGYLREKAPPGLRKTYPVSDVGKAVAEGFERRSRLVLVPKWLRVAMALRSLLVPLSDRATAAEAAEIDARFERHAAQVGAEEASAPVGAGGEAVRDSVVSRG